VWGEVFTAVHPESRTRQEYYTAVAKDLGLTAPKFVQGGSTVGKIVKGQEKLQQL
jgi:hypothetical protein